MSASNKKLPNMKMIETSSYKTNKLWKANVQQGDYN